MFIVADTSPINYLIVIERIGILPLLYSRVSIPQAVFDELTHSAAPVAVREWTADHPSWLKVATPRHTTAIPQLDTGESQAIWPAAALCVLNEAEQAGLLDFSDSLTPAQERVPGISIRCS